MALANPADVKARLKASEQHLVSDDEPHAEALLDEASDLVIAFLGCDPSESGATVPGPVVRVTARMVARVLQQGATGVAVGANSYTKQTGPFGTTLGFSAGTTDGTPYLKATDKRALGPYRCGGGLASVAMTTGRTGRYRRDLP